MPAVPVTIDVLEGRIFSGTPSVPGPELDSITIGPYSYELQGNYLVSRDPAARAYQLGNEGPAILTGYTSGEYDLINAVQRRRINAPGLRGRGYAVSGDVSVLTASGDRTVVTLSNISVLNEGTRLYRFIDEDGELVTAKVSSEIRTNEQLQQSLNIPTAQFLTPNETVRHALIKYLYEHEADIIKDTFRDVDLQANGYNDTYSGAAQYLADHADLNKLSTLSILHIRP